MLIVLVVALVLALLGVGVVAVIRGTELKEVSRAVDHLRVALDTATSDRAHEAQRAQSAEVAARELLDQRLNIEETRSKDRIEELGRALTNRFTAADERADYQRQRADRAEKELAGYKEALEREKASAGTANDRRRVAEIALADFKGASERLHDHSDDQYFEWLRENGFENHRGPIIEFRPTDVVTETGEHLPPILLVRLPVVVENLAETSPISFDRSSLEVRSGRLLTTPHREWPFAWNGPRATRQFGFKTPDTLVRSSTRFLTTDRRSWSGRWTFERSAAPDVGPPIASGGASVNAVGSPMGDSTKDPGPDGPISASNGHTRTSGLSVQAFCSQTGGSPRRHEAIMVTRRKGLARSPISCPSTPPPEALT